MGINIRIVIFHLFAQSLHEQISTKFCIAVELVDVITCDKSFGDRFRDVDSVGGRK